MNEVVPSNRRVAFTLIELLLLIGVVVVLAAFLYPTHLKKKQQAQRISCMGRLKQTGLSFRIWAGDDTNLYPMQIAMEFGGTKEHIATGETFRHFEIMSNELNTPLILTCPSDKARTEVRSFVPTFSNSNISYFIGLDADEAHPQRFLAGDRNILGGALVGTNTIELTSTNGVGWARDLHRNQGNVLLADGSVQVFSSAALRTGLVDTGLATNRLALP